MGTFLYVAPFSLCRPSPWPGEWVAVLSLSLTLQLPLAIRSSGVSGTYAQAELFSAGVGGEGTRLEVHPWGATVGPQPRGPRLDSSQG